MAAVASTFSAVTRAAKTVWWYMGELVGDKSYEKYVAHIRARHPERPVPTKKEFWKVKYDEQEANPASRCC